LQRQGLCKNKAFAKTMKKILLIEDDEAISRVYSDSLTDAGYEVSLAYDGEEGLEKAKKLQPDLILLDLLLPKMDGIEVLKEMKKEESLKNVPVIVLTNLVNNDKISEAVALGSKIYMVKSNYSVDDILLKIKESLK
jgi:two-component system, OmpR family, response regulator VicR